MVYMYHIFFIHSSMDGHLNCFHVLVIINSAAMNIGMCVSFWIMVLATHSSVLAWRIPGTAEPGGLRSMRSHRIRHNWSNLAAAAAAAGPEYKEIYFFNIYIYLFIVLGFSCSTQDLWSSLLYAGSLVAACGISFHNQGSNPGPLHAEHRVLATGPPGES